MRAVLTLMTFCAMAVAAHGQSPVSASVSAERVTVGEVFYITISANGGNIKEPDMQVVADAGIQLGAPSHQSSTSISSAQGATTVVQSRTWRYPASVQREGALTIPRVSVMVDGNEYLTQPMAIEATRTLDMGSRTPGQTEELTIEDLAFVRAVTDKTTVYQGEPVVLRLRINVIEGHYASVEGPRSFPMPDIEGFYPGTQWQQTATEQLYGRAYRINEFNQVLFPTMTGQLTIGAWEWQGAVRWHDARRRQQRSVRMFTTNPIPITVLPLPSRPENFSGAVGKFSARAQLANTTLTQGEPVRFSVVVSGEGNPSAIGAPVLPDMPWAHISGPETDTQTINEIEVSKTFSWLLTPLDIGEFTLEPAEFVYFAPILKNYKTERTRPFTVTVAPSPESGDFIAVGGMAEEERRRIQVFEDGLAPIITDAQQLTRHRHAGTGLLSLGQLTSPLGSLLLVGLLGLYLKKRERLAGDHGYARRYHARTRCLKTLTEARKTTDATEGLYRAMTGFVADMLNVNEAGLTSSDVETLLREQHVEETLVAIAGRTLRACERARYAARDTAPDEAEALFSAARELVDKLHAVLREKQP